MSRPPRRKIVTPSPSTPTGERAIAVEYRPLRELVAWPRNPKLHAGPAIVSSIRRFGFNDPVALNTHPQARWLLEGHGRVEALRTLHAAGGPPPQNILAAAGDWSVPTISLCLPPGQAEAYALAHNQLVTAGGWDEDGLKSVVASLRESSIDLDGLGWDLDELDALGAPTLPKGGGEPGGPPKDAPPELDAADALQAKWQTAVGQVWRCGQSFLVCGDGADPRVLAAVPGREPFALTFTSPPYGDQRDYKNEGFDWSRMVPAVLVNAHRQGRADHQVLVNLGLVHRERRVVMYWTPLLEAMDAAGAPLFGWYVWDQGDGLPGDWHGRCAPAHEFVFHFTAQPRHPNKIVRCKCAGEVSHPENDTNGGLRERSGKHRAWTHQGVPVPDFKIPDSVLRLPRQYGGVEGHPAPFTVALAKFVLEAYSVPGEWVCDPFVGSGTTILAAEQCDRRCVGIDIAPAYVAVALQRYQDVLSQVPERVA